MFHWGVASGDPTTSSVVVWTRVAGPARPLRWEVGERSGRSTVLACGEVTSDPSSDGTVRAEVGGLPAGTALWYRFRGPGGTTSPMGFTATLPADPERFSIGIACCADWTAGSFDAYGWLASHRPDVVLHLGDYVYEHRAGGRRRQHDPRRDCRSLEDFRSRYEQYRSDPDLAALHAVAPWFSLWDDHEFTTDAWHLGRALRRRSSGVPGVAGAARVDDSVRANLEWLPRSPDTASSHSLDRHRRIGDLLDLLVLDCRTGRHQPVTDDGGPGLAPEADDGHPPLLAAHQWRWLEDVLARPAPRWTVVASSVQVSPLRLAELPSWSEGRPRLRPLVNPDQWDGHPRDRARLLELLAPREGTTLLVSGDLHGRFLTSASHQGRSFPELTVPSVTATSFIRLIQRRLPLPRRALEGWLRLLNPHITELDGHHHGAALLELRPDGIEVATGPAAPTRRRLTGRSWE